MQIQEDDQYSHVAYHFYFFRYHFSINIKQYLWVVTLMTFMKSKKQIFLRIWHKI